MAKFLFALLAIFLCSQGICGITIISRSQWGARTSKGNNPGNKNLGYVIIHHSEGAYCTTLDTCKQQMRNMQSYHMDSQGWDDIGYNFGIGADGNIYEGRGFGQNGVHASGYNSLSIGIMFIGNYFNQTPTATQVAKAKELIAHAVSQGWLKSGYVLKGHRQVSATDCPGTNLYNEIKKWSNWKA